MAQPLWFEDLSPGQFLPELVKGPISTAHIMRWSAAMENWHRIHYDWRYATEHDKLPDVMVNGSWRQHVLIQLVLDWLNDAGWLWKIGFQFRGMNVPGETLTAWGQVRGLVKRGPFGVVSLDVGLKNQNGEEGTPGHATAIVPCRNGPPVPYPFDPKILGQD
jgi:acyl dehydratase